MAEAGLGSLGSTTPISNRELWVVIADLGPSSTCLPDTGATFLIRSLFLCCQVQDTTSPREPKITPLSFNYKNLSFPSRAKNEKQSTHLVLVIWKVLSRQKTDFCVQVCLCFLEHPFCCKRVGNQSESDEWMNESGYHDLFLTGHP